MEVSGGLGAAGESRLLFTSKLSQLMRYRINQKTRIMKSTKRTNTTSQGVVMHQCHKESLHEQTYRCKIELPVYDHGHCDHRQYARKLQGILSGPEDDVRNNERHQALEERVVPLVIVSE